MPNRTVVRGIGFPELLILIRSSEFCVEYRSRPGRRCSILKVHKSQCLAAFSMMTPFLRISFQVFIRKPRTKLPQTLLTSSAKMCTWDHQTEYRCGHIWGGDFRSLCEEKEQILNDTGCYEMCPRDVELHEVAIYCELPSCHRKQTELDKAELRAAKAKALKIRIDAN